MASMRMLRVMECTMGYAGLNQRIRIALEVMPV